MSLNTQNVTHMGILIEGIRAVCPLSSAYVCHCCQLSFPSALWNSSNHPRVVHNSLYPSIHMWFCSTRDEGLVDPRLVWQDCVVWRRRSAPLPLHQQSTEHRCLLVAAALAARARRGRSQVFLLLATLAQHGFAPLQQRAGG